MLTSSWPLRQPEEEDFEEQLLEDWEFYIGAPVILGSKREASGLEDRKEFMNSAKTNGMISRGQSTRKVAGVLTVECEGPIAMSQLQLHIPWTEWNYEVLS